MALGFAPLTLGYVLVEFAALLVPKWRPLRAGSQAGRAQLHRASLILGLFVAFVQSIFLTSAFKNLGAPMVSAIAAVTLPVAATAALIVLTWLSNNEGLGSGFSSLVLATSILWVSAPLGNALTAFRLGIIPFSTLSTEYLGLGVLVITALFLFSRFCLPETGSHVLRIGRPACGLAPLTVLPRTLAFGALTVGSGYPHGRANSLRIVSSRQGTFSSSAFLARSFLLISSILLTGSQGLGTHYRPIHPKAFQG